jgi:2-hydroxycyclohexanecarboxyl-CoA dehydrogenase
MSLNGKVAVVTGSGSGIGRACAIKLAQDGAAVAVWDLNGKGAEETVQEIVKNGGKAIAMVVDCASSAAIHEAANKVREQLGPITVLVNNAGMTGFTPVLDISEDHWDKMMAVNLKGPFLCCKEMIPDMRAAGWGRIVNISSSSIQTGAPAMAHYISSKGGVMGLTKALAIELAAENITVNSVPPGFIITPMLEASPIDPVAYAATMPMKRGGQPEDIANAVSYLASEGAGYVTGQTISVNGGRYLGSA